MQSLEALRYVDGAVEVWATHDARIHVLSAGADVDRCRQAHKDHFDAVKAHTLCPYKFPSMAGHS